jgi:hypothetical protein
MTINLISSFIKLNSKEPNNLLDDCKVLKDSTAVIAQSELTLLSQQEWSEAIVHDDE